VLATASRDPGTIPAAPPYPPRMILAHYGLREPAFSITPDPRFVFLSERHRDGLAHLLFGIGQGGGGGFVQLTGEVGTGKTTLCRLLLDQLPANTRVALILNPLLSPVELLEAIARELHIPLRGRLGQHKRLVDALNTYLLQAYAEGLRVVLIIDEAQDLSPAALEQVRLLTNLETPQQKLLQIVLLGQPELREMIGKRELRQLAQRITARFHLTPLDATESESYLRHRFAVAGGGRFPFTAGAVRRLHKRAGGIPRLLNILAERALLAGYVLERVDVDAKMVDRAAAEVLAPTNTGWRGRLRWLGVALLLAGASVAVAAGGWHVAHP
jgi:general secretion pathway protein A